MATKWRLIKKMRGKRSGVSLTVPANRCPPGTTDRHEVQATLFNDEIIEGDFWAQWEGSFLERVPEEKPKVSGSALGLLARKAKPVAAAPDAGVVTAAKPVIEKQPDAPAPVVRLEPKQPEVVEPAEDERVESQTDNGAIEPTPPGHNERGEDGVGRDLAGVDAGLHSVAGVEDAGEDASDGDSDEQGAATTATTIRRRRRRKA